MDEPTQTPTDSYSHLSTTLKEIYKKFVELSEQDFSNIHVSHEWSWMPYIKDHLNFLAEQTGGLLSHLKDSPPPVSKDVENP